MKTKRYSILFSAVQFFFGYKSEKKGIQSFHFSSFAAVSAPIRLTTILQAILKKHRNHLRAVCC